MHFPGEPESDGCQGESSRSHEANVAEVVGATSSESFLDLLQLSAECYNNLQTGEKLNTVFQSQVF